jgi:hypothetical protein
VNKTLTLIQSNNQEKSLIENKSAALTVAERTKYESMIQKLDRADCEQMPR